MEPVFGDRGCMLDTSGSQISRRKLLLLCGLVCFCPLLCCLAHCWLLERSHDRVRIGSPPAHTSVPTGSNVPHCVFIRYIVSLLLSGLGSCTHIQFRKCSSPTNTCRGTPLALLCLTGPCALACWIPLQRSPAQAASSASLTLACQVGSR